ncbi:GvpL/GvpF family gas vesicle protein [Streptomyces actinomycinicus]|uniref:GvpL/GvpF family gas vesicle protein n=1 Tax=Streptomyces actinomycinicus TaxID=1695166 RepID=A0A937EIT1_9ACTN|nr:GvpL/GvpF family gas vesicle protein [Streptomyces actinomycinicus]MBL1083872.1 GvpL/GvpF family gas vesicle protein [Streptomyces actinomycinicus]
MTGLRYVYAVCRPFGTPLQAQLTGIGGAPPALLHHHGLVAVVSTVPAADFSEEALKARLEDLDWLAATARAHEGVIDALTTVTTPLPLRLATVFRDDSAVRMMIEAREDHFRQLLDRLGGRVEWGVKVYLEAEPAEATPAPAAKPASGRDYLRSRRAQSHALEEKWQRAEQFARSLHERLTERAEDFRMHRPQNAELSGAAGRNVMNAAYLVPRKRSEEFVELVDRTKDEAPGIRVELTGPWAAYSFTGETAGETAGEAAGEAAGETAGKAAGETVGETAGATVENAGEGR